MSLEIFFLEIKDQIQKVLLEKHDINCFKGSDHELIECFFYLSEFNGISRTALEKGWQGWKVASLEDSCDNEFITIKVKKRGGFILEFSLLDLLPGLNKENVLVEQKVVTKQKVCDLTNA